MFACAHPAIEPAIRAPLILQAILGFDAASIGSALLVSPVAMSRRLVRAKNKIRHDGIPLRVPRAQTCPRASTRCSNPSTRASPRTGPIRPAPSRARRNLADEATWLGRLVVSLLPEEPEALGLLARTDERDAAAAAYERAIGLEPDPAVRRFLDRRRAATVLRERSR
jgi:RNA polymerase sigma-70 factor (ECF subfamily)